VIILSTNRNPCSVRVYILYYSEPDQNELAREGMNKNQQCKRPFKAPSFVKDRDSKQQKTSPAVSAAPDAVAAVAPGGKENASTTDVNLMHLSAAEIFDPCLIDDRRHPRNQLLHHLLSQGNSPPSQMRSNTARSSTSREKCFRRYFCVSSGNMNV